MSVAASRIVLRNAVVVASRTTLRRRSSRPHVGVPPAYTTALASSRRAFAATTTTTASDKKKKEPALADDEDAPSSSLKDTVERMQRKEKEEAATADNNSHNDGDDKQKGGEGASSSSTSSGGPALDTSTLFVRAADAWDSFRTAVGTTWNELLQSGQRKSINKKIHPVETAGGDAPYTGPVDIMVIDESEHLNAWERMQKRLTEAPIIQDIFERSEEIYVKTGAKQVKERVDVLKEDAREAWETSQNPWVYRLSSVYDTVTADSPESVAVKELRQLDPTFTLEDWRQDVVEHTLPIIMRWFLEGRINQLKPWLGEGVFKRLAAEMTAREQEGTQIDTNLLGIMNSEILAVEVSRLWVLLLLLLLFFVAGVCKRNVWVTTGCVAVNNCRLSICSIVDVSRSTLSPLLYLTISLLHAKHKNNNTAGRSQQGLAHYSVALYVPTNQLRAPKGGRGDCGRGRGRHTSPFVRGGLSARVRRRKGRAQLEDCGFPIQWCHCVFIMK